MWANVVCLQLLSFLCIIMVALHSRCRHSILPLWFLLSSSFFFSSPILSSHRFDVYHISTHDVALVSANLECRSDMCCTWLAENTGCKNYAKKLPSEHHRTTLSSCIFATKACIDNWKNNLLNINIFSISSHNMVNVGTAEIDSGV